jgi:hypothetical protein
MVQFLAVPDQLEPGQTGRIGQDNGASHNRAGQGPPPDLVNACDKFIALRVELVLVVKVWQMRHVSPKTKNQVSKCKMLIVRIQIEDKIFDS